MMNYTPKGTPKTAVFLSACCLALTLVFLCLSTLWGDFISNMFKMTSVVFFAAALLVIARYLTFSFTYIADCDGFSVRRSSKFGSETVCRLYYSDIVSLEPTESFRKKKTEYSRIYNYCASVRPRKSYTLCYELKDETVAVRFEPDAIFAGYLEKYVNNDIILP